MHWSLTSISCTSNLTMSQILGVCEGEVVCSSERQSCDLSHLEKKRKCRGRKGVQKHGSLISILIMKKMRVRKVRPIAQGHPAMFWVLRNGEGHSLGIAPSSLLWEGAWWGSFLPGSCLPLEQLRMLGQLNLFFHSSPRVSKFMKTANNKYTVLGYFCLGLPKPEFLSGDTSSWKLVIDDHALF